MSKATLWVLAYGVAFVGGSLAGAQAPDHVVYQNNDELWGQLETVSAEGLVTWRRDDLSQPLSFATEVVSAFRLGAEEPTNFARGQWRVFLTNEDYLDGRIVGFDDMHLRLETEYAGELQIPRAHVQSMTPSFSKAPNLYSGPDGLDGWTVGDVTLPDDEGGYWLYRDGALYADLAASIARDVNLPDLSSVELDLMWQGSLNVALALYTDFLYPISLANKEQEPKFGAFYSLQVNDRASTVLAIAQDEPIRRLGYAFTPALTRKNTARVQALCDRTQGTITLVIDGVVAHTWNDPRGFQGAGRGIRLVHQGQGQVRVSGIRIKRWNGVLPESGAPKPSASGDMLIPVGGDPKVGECVAIEGERVSFRYRDGTEASLTMDQIQTLAFSDVGLLGTPRAPQAARVSLSTDERFLLKVSEITDEHILGTHPAIGLLRVRRNRVESIDFSRAND